MSLRDEQRQLTRRKILDAVIDLVADGTLDELSVPAVSRQAGVSLATIYRYFPTKDELLVAAALEPARQAFDSATYPRGDGVDELAAYQRAMWTELAGRLPLLRHQVGSAAGREMRKARLGQSRQLLGQYLIGHGIEPTTPEGARLMAVLLLVGSSLGFLELHDRQALSVDESLDVALWAAQSLIETTKKET